MPSTKAPSLSGPRSSDLSAKNQANAGRRRLSHSSTTGISDLPNEVLSQIMLIVCELSRKFSDARLHLSWVCSRWRDVAIGDPQLWRIIRNTPYMTTNLEYIEECFSRSKILDSDIEIDRPVDYNEVFELCMSQIPRTRSLVYTPPDRTLTMGMILYHLEEHRREWDWCREAPHLSSLVLKETVVARKPFRGVYPKLKYLKLVKCWLDAGWDFPLSVSTLTTLHIVCPAGWVSVDLLVKKLAMMPSLTELYLRSCLDTWKEPVVTRQYCLPSLRSLSIDEEKDHAWAFFRMIDAPNLSSLRGYIQLEASLELEEFTTTLDMFKKVRPSVWTDIRHLIIRPSTSIEAGSSPSPCETVDIMWFDIHSGNHYPHLQIHRLPIHNLETLSISGFRQLPGIAASLPSLRGVKKLRLGAIKQGVISGLLTNTQTGEISLPSLEEIHCQCKTTLEAEILRDALEQRREILQRRLPKLTFAKCRDYMEMFTELVDSIESDEVMSVEYKEDMDREESWD